MVYEQQSLFSYTFSPFQHFNTVKILNLRINLVSSIIFWQVIILTNISRASVHHRSSIHSSYLTSVLTLFLGKTNQNVCANYRLACFMCKLHARFSSSYPQKPQGVPNFKQQKYFCSQNFIGEIFSTSIIFTKVVNLKTCKLKI